MCFVAVIEGRACVDRCGVRIEYFVDLCKHAVLTDNGDIYRCRYRNRIPDSVPSPVMCDDCEARWLGEWDAWVTAQFGSIAQSVMLLPDLDPPDRTKAAADIRDHIRRANAQIRRNYERERARLMGLLADELDYAKTMFYCTGESVRSRLDLPLDVRRGMPPDNGVGGPRWQVDYRHFRYLYRLVPGMVRHFVLERLRRERGLPLRGLGVKRQQQQQQQERQEEGERECNCVQEGE